VVRLLFVGVVGMDLLLGVPPFSLPISLWSKGPPEYICIIKLLYIASLPELLAQFLATVNAAAGGQSQLLPVYT